MKITMSVSLHFCCMAEDGEHIVGNCDYKSLEFED